MATQRPTPLIRTAVAADLPVLQRIFREASLSNPGDADALLAHPEHLELSGDAIAFGRTRVAELDGAVVGFATVGPDDEGTPELVDLFTDPAWRRRGAARALVLDAAATARAAGHAALVVTGNAHALPFYLAVGFAQVGSAPTPLGPTAPRLRLSL